MFKVIYYILNQPTIEINIILTNHSGCKVFICNVTVDTTSIILKYNKPVKNNLPVPKPLKMIMSLTVTANKSQYYV